MLRPTKSLIIFKFQNGFDVRIINGRRTPLEFYTKHGCTPIDPAFGDAADVPLHLNPTRCARMLNNWLEECITGHTTCVTPLSKLPKRVVDISGDVPKVVETQGLTFSRCTTLSHCWGGGADVIKTTRSNLSRLNGYMLVRTFSDF